MKWEGAAMNGEGAGMMSGSILSSSLRLPTSYFSRSHSSLLRSAASVTLKMVGWVFCRLARMNLIEKTL